jgi:hypothetical protein
MARKRKGAQDAFEAAEERIGNWREFDGPGRYNKYWKDNEPDDSENWVDVEHDWGSGQWYGGTSDECLAKSNYEYIQSNVVNAYQDDVITDIRNGQFAIRAFRRETPDEVPEGDEPALVTTTAWDTWIDIENLLEDYVSLDDDAMGECEQEAAWEETVENVKYAVRNLEDFEARSDLPERWVSDVINYVTENLYNYWDHVDSSADGIDISEEHIIEAMLNLRYLKRLRDYIDEDVKD